MEINLIDNAWPTCVLRCHEALKQLQPGADLILTVCDPDVVDKIRLLIEIRPDLCCKQFQESESYRITVHRTGRNQASGGRTFLKGDS